VVRKLDGKEFCERKFVMGLAAEDGFGNNMYKLLGAAGLALMLNRSLIIGTYPNRCLLYHSMHIKQKTNSNENSSVDFARLFCSFCEPTTNRTARHRQC
jgi:hypothetical protein